MNPESPQASTFDRIQRSLERDRQLPVMHLVRKALRYGAASALAPFYLLDCDSVGSGARTIGRPLIESQGQIEIGSRAILNSMFTPIHLSTAPGGRIRIGDDAAINFGVHIHAASSVTLGSRVSLGPEVTISDTEGEAGAPEVGAPKDIVIGDDVWLAARVRVEKGARIGDGAVITAGSEVRGEIPARVVAGGVPARVLRSLEGGDREAAIAEANESATQGAEANQSAEANGSSCPAGLPLDPEVAKAADVRGLLIGDFSIQELAAALRTHEELGPRVAASVAPFDQVMQTLHKLEAEIERHHSDFAVVWTRPESFAGFSRLLAGESVSIDEVLAEVDAFAALVKDKSPAVKTLFVPSWVLSPFERGLGMIDMRPGGVAHALLRMNARLCEALASAPNVFVLPTDRWIAAAGKDALSSKMWYLGKVGYSAAVFAEAARDIRAALRGIRGAAKKLVILDLDDTLWGGIVGDLGWENLRLGGHDGLGEAYVDFQRHLKALTKRGILLAIVSKNEEATALEAIAKHPEMALRIDDFCAYRINWRDKAANIADMVHDLNLGLQSVMFIDDNPVERARVREALPEVFVPEWPEDKFQYARALLELRCFDTPVISREDAERTKMYASERQREALKSEVASLDDWLKGLNLRVRFARLDGSNLPRTAQLLNKTNQMNLSTRRLSDKELLGWSREPGHEVWAVYVSDRFGEAGLTGILGLSKEDGALRVADYVLSCRVMGRKVEETLIAASVLRAKALGARRVEAKYLATAKNKPCLDLWKRSGFALDEATMVFSWDVNAPYPMPDVVKVEGLEAVASVEAKEVMYA